MAIEIDREYLVDTLADLVRIDSINPSLTPGSPGEAEIAAHVGDAMRELGLEVATHEPEPGRISVAGMFRGAGGGRSLMLNAHTDTVGVEGMQDPFSARIDGGRMVGRGAYDMKGSLAACMAAVKALRDASLSLRGDLLLAAVADEEYASIGTADLVKRYSVDAAIVTEATEMQICVAHKGFMWVEVETLGRAAHGSRFDEGIDANMRMGRFLAELDKLAQELRARGGRPLVGPPSLHAAMINGGSELSAYAARCTLQIERRTIPGETEMQVAAELQAIVDSLTASDATFRATVRPYFVREPFEAAADSPIVGAVTRIAADVLGRQPAHVGMTPWMDSAILAAAGVDTVVFGPSGAGAHAHEEWVDLESLYELALILARTAIDYCQ